MATGNFKINFFDKDKVFRVSTIKAIDPDTYRPIDVIQAIYQDGQYAPVGGGTTIWKMGRCTTALGTSRPVPGALLSEIVTLSMAPNSILPGDELSLVEYKLP